MKPDWKDIPDWVEWISMDEDGCWCGYENKPIFHDIDLDWYEPSGGRWEILGRDDPRHSLERRPK